MRIGIEAHRLFRQKKHGMEVVTLELIKQLQKIDKENEYVIFVHDDKEKECLQETDNFKIYLVPGLTFADWEQISLPIAVKKSKVDILHCTSNTAPLFSSVPTILTLHDIIYLESVNFESSVYQNFGNVYRRIVVSQILRRSDKIITVSDFEKNRIIKATNTPEEKLEVLYNGVSADFKQIDDDQLISQFRTDHGLPDRFILFFGNTAYKKNTKGVLRAYYSYCQDNDNALPLVITDSSKEYVNKILGEQRISELQDKLIIIDYTPYRNQPLMYNAATLFLYPSIRESFGMPILESMACGTPVITSSSSSMPEIAGDAALFVDPSNPTDIVDGIRQILGDEKLYEEKRIKGKERAKQFRWEDTAQKLLNIYNSFNVAEKL